MSAIIYLRLGGIRINGAFRQSFMFLRPAQFSLITRTESSVPNTVPARRNLFVAFDLLWLEIITTIDDFSPPLGTHSPGFAP